MNKASLTFTFDENEMGYAIYDGSVVASHHDIDELENLAQIEIAQMERKPKRRSNRVVVNPSGLKGTALGKPEPSLWGEDVTIRFENGEIRRIATVFVEPDTDPIEKTAGTEETTFVDGLNSRLSATYAETPESLVKRHDELENVKVEATTLLSAKPSFDEERELHSIVVAANHELEEIEQALDHYALQESNEFQPPQPFKVEAVEQAGLGGNDSTWLDHTVQGLIDENRGTDYEKLLSEGPALLVAEQETGTLASTSATQATALDYITSKTAMIQDDSIKEYERVFLARVEEARKEEYKERTAQITKEAADNKRNLDNVPDAGLFL